MEEKRLTSEERAKQVADALVDCINDFGFKADIIADRLTSCHPTLQQTAYTLIARFVRNMAEKNYVDGRNQFAHNQCKKMWDAIKEYGVNAPCI